MKSLCSRSSSLGISCCASLHSSDGCSRAHSTKPHRQSRLRTVRRTQPNHAGRQTERDARQDTARHGLRSASDRSRFIPRRWVFSELTSAVRQRRPRTPPARRRYHFLHAAVGCSAPRARLSMPILAQCVRCRSQANRCQRVRCGCSKNLRLPSGYARPRGLLWKPCFCLCAADLAPLPSDRLGPSENRQCWARRHRHPTPTSRDPGRRSVPSVSRLL